MEKQKKDLGGQQQSSKMAVVKQMQEKWDKEKEEVARERDELKLQC